MILSPTRAPVQWPGLTWGIPLQCPWSLALSAGEHLAAWVKLTYYSSIFRNCSSQLPGVPHLPTLCFLPENPKPRGEAAEMVSNMSTWHFPKGPEFGSQLPHQVVHKAYNSSWGNTMLSPGLCGHHHTYSCYTHIRQHMYKQIKINVKKTLPRWIVLLVIF